MSLTPAQWRILTALCPFPYDRTAFARNAAKLVAEQGAERDNLIELQGFELIKAAVGLLSVESQDVADWTVMEVSASHLAGRRLKGSSLMLIVGALVRHRGETSALDDLRRLTGVETAQLRVMEDDGLITAHARAAGEVVPLRTFRRPPARLYIKLTSKGRRYYAA